MAEDKSNVQIAVMSEQIKTITKDVGDIKNSVHDINKKIEDTIGALTQKIDDTYVTKSEFQPIRSVVYGMIGIILTAVLSAIVYLVVEGR